MQEAALRNEIGETAVAFSASLGGGHRSATLTLTLLHPVRETPPGTSSVAPLLTATLHRLGRQFKGCGGPHLYSPPGRHRPNLLPRVGHLCCLTHHVQTTDMYAAANSRKASFAAPAPDTDKTLSAQVHPALVVLNLGGAQCRCAGR